MTEKRQEESRPPSSLPESAPPGFTGHTLSTVIEINRTLGKLEQAVEDLSKQSSTQSMKLDDIGKTVHAGKTLLIAAGVILGALGGVVVFFLNKIWDVLVPLMQIKPHP